MMLWLAGQFFLEPIFLAAFLLILLTAIGLMRNLWRSPQTGLKYIYAHFLNFVLDI